MRFSHLFALAGVAVLMAGLLFVLDTDASDVAVAAPTESFVEVNTTEAEVFAEEALMSATPFVPDEGPPLDAFGEGAAPTTTTTTVAQETPDTTSATPPPTTPATPTATTSTTLAPQPTTTTTAAAPVASGGFRSDYESDFRSRINSLRSANGLASMSSNSSLNSRARSWAKSMAEAGQLSHSNIANLLPPWSAAGENVGKGGSVSSIFGSLQASSGHLANMKGEYTDFGVGVYEDANGVLWTTHVFTR